MAPLWNVLRDMAFLWYAISLWSYWGKALEVSHPGNVMIGGLFPVHKKVSSKDKFGGFTNCSDIDLAMLAKAETMIYTIEKINKSPYMLPGVTIGYRMFDSCADVSVATKGTLKMFEESRGSPNMCPLLEETPGTRAQGVKVVIGERDSETSAAVARLLALPMVAQISYASTSEILSSKVKFPSFLRTVPSDKHQTMAMAQFVKKQGWDIVGVIGSDDEYGKYGSETLADLFNKMGACIAFKEILPADFTQNEPFTRTKLAEIFKKINTNHTDAIVLFTKTRNVKAVLEEAIKQGEHRTWLASDSWSTSTEMSGLKNIERIGRVFGFISKRNKVPGFQKYISQLIFKERNSTGGSFLMNYMSQHPLCPTDNRDTPSLCESSDSGHKCSQLYCLYNDNDLKGSYSIYLAVNIIAHALHSLLKCNDIRCKGSTSFHAWELLQEIKKVNITVDDKTHIFFDENGDPCTGQEILEWIIDESKVTITSIGEYEISGTIKMYRNLTMDNSTKTSCSKSCKPGYELQQLDNSCCKICQRCKAKFFSKEGGAECQACPNDSYVSPKRDGCLKKETTFLKWSDELAIALAVFDGVGAILTVLVAVLFAMRRNTPIVKAAGGYLCFLALLSLLACFSSVAVGLSEPQDHICQIELPLFLLAFTLCISCILANLLQIFVGFTFRVRLAGTVKHLNRPAVVTGVCISVQVVLCALWFCHGQPPKMELDYHHETQILKSCSKGSWHYSLAMFLYICLLSAVCFMFAYNGRQLPDLYKNARYVTVSMLIYLVVCILFLPFYIMSSDMYREGIKACVFLVSTYSVLLCHFGPKCHIILFKSSLNNENAIAEYIRNHYQQKSIRVVSS